MKVGINLFPLERKTLTGIELYTQRLVEGLVRRNVVVSGYSYTKIEGDIINKLYSYSYFTKRNKTNSLGKLLYNLFTIDRFITEEEIFHGTFFSLPFKNKAKKKVVTIHDLAFRRFPQYFDKKALLFYKVNLDYSLTKADRIICVSNSCYNDLMQFYPDKIVNKARVIYNGFDKVKVQDEHRQDYDFSKFGKYFLFVGAHHPRKNIENMLKAYALFSKKGFSYNIVFTGKVDDRIFSDFFLSFPHLEKSIFCLGYVSGNLLQQLYTSAELLLLPSLYEGFGFPILEAMSRGIPVLTSNTTSCKEIAGYDDSYLVNPSDPFNIAETLELLLKVEVKKKLIGYGFERVREFSWDKMVDETIQVYND